MGDGVIRVLASVIGRRFAGRRAPGSAAPGRSVTKVAYVSRTEGNHMPDVDIDTALDWRGRTVVDRNGKKIGTFDELFLDEDDRPAWAGVTTGLFGRRQTFVPLSQAERVGDDLQVPYDEQAVKDAPNIDPAEQLSPDEEAVLYEHYGMRSSGPRAEADVGAPAQVDEQQGAVVADAATPEPDTEAEGPGDDRPTALTDDPGASQEGTVKAPASGPAPGESVEPDASRDAMTRSEEELVVGTRTRERGRARLKKYVVTEHVQKTVPVRREEVRVEFEPTRDDSEPANEQDPPPEP
jgi:hypothetical protein